MIRSSVVAGGDEQHGGGVDSDAVDVQQLGCGGFDERSDLLVDRGELGVEGVDPAGQDHRRGLRSLQGDITAGAWAELGGLVDQLCCGQPTQPCAQLVGCGEHQMAELNDRADPRRARRSLGDQQRPQRLGMRVTRLGATLTTTRQRAARRLDRVELVALAVPPTLLPVRSIDLDHDHTRRNEVAGDAGPIRAGALDPDPFDRARTPTSTTTDSDARPPSSGTTRPPTARRSCRPPQRRSRRDACPPHPPHGAPNLRSSRPPLSIVALRPVPWVGS